VTVDAEAMDDRGTIHRLSAADLGFTYRQSSVPENRIFLGATLAGRKDERVAIERRMAEIAGAREESQPLRTRTGGSTFKNPEGQSAWRLVEEAGCRGLTRGGAMVSPMHCNFLINTGTATAAEIEALGEEVRRRVLDMTGITLEWEIKRVGVPAPAVRRAGAPR
jgi:UDP-N-acetylmuramate dehydrogenase